MSGTNVINDTDMYNLQVISNATIMIVSVTASTTQGQLLSEEELNHVMDACDMADDLLVAKLKILNYVESKMAFIAPNITAITGMPSASRTLFRI